MLDSSSSKYKNIYYCLVFSKNEVDDTFQRVIFPALAVWTRASKKLCRNPALLPAKLLNTKQKFFLAWNQRLTREFLFSTCLTSRTKYLTTLNTAGKLHIQCSLNFAAARRLLFAHSTPTWNANQRGLDKVVFGWQTAHPVQFEIFGAQLGAFSFSTPTWNAN